ncbi:MAG: tetratricopeptide repeat protein [Candidatus Nitrohelix vancouverensis]|uniref:Tetratricopeptide repeat protein n=1 Tax=Candidatus Nitrohelix vancouverensis TaxID=2705534 RepID=A0A7T0G334_9BACT|nr:MAG: tetratricopeptide repeat protein [Candidatus Nitrohelix vancouverensis]
MSEDKTKEKTAEEWCQEGLLAGRAGDNRTSMESYKKAVELDPDHFLAQFNLGLRYGKIPMNVEAAKCFREAVRIKPEDAMAHYSLAVVTNLIGETDVCLAHYREAIRINPKFAKAHSNVAMVHYSLKQGRETIHHLLKAEALLEELGDERMRANALDLLNECYREFKLTAEECREL